jgi:hypothetical protein
MEVSGNGNVLLGSKPDVNSWAPWIWSQADGTTFFSKTPPKYGVSLAINADGSVVAGYFENLLANQYPYPYPPHAFQLFRWTAKTGIQIIPEKPNSDYIGGINLSDDGKIVSFWCIDERAENFRSTSCNDAQPSTMRSSDGIETWTQGAGYRYLGAGIDKKFYIEHQAGNLESYLVSSTSGQNFCRYGRLDTDGRYFPFKYPPFYNYKPCNGIIASNENTFFIETSTPLNAEPLFWNASGELLPLPKLPPSCGNLSVQAIDGHGVIYGQAWCGSGNVGWRITSSGAETISAWLKGAGLGDNFPPDTVISTVSDNGQTVIGGQDTGIFAAGGEASRSANPAQGLISPGPPGAESGFGEGNNFIAHVPQ